MSPPLPMDWSRRPEFIPSITPASPHGKVDTIIYESTRPKSDRVSRVWHAPSLGFTAVRVEQIRKGKTETVMTLVSYERK